MREVRTSKAVYSRTGAKLDKGIRAGSRLYERRMRRSLGSR